MTASGEDTNTAHKWFIVTAVMLSTVMEILDTTIVNVSLPHMMGSLSADRDQISWVLTSYIVAAGVLMPLTGFLVGRFGSKNLLLINIAGFMCSSALCGISSNLAEMVFFRLLQGVFGASLMPLSQFILRDTFSASEQPKMMAIWGIGVMAAPVLGPTLGGFITDTMNWRWIFYINVPVCIVNFFLVWTFIKSAAPKKETIDWTGMILMIVSVASLQLFLDRGEVDDWFSSDTICWLAVICLVSGGWFFNHCRTTAKPIINLRLFSQGSFGVGTLMMTLFAASFFGCIALMPQMLETLFGYTSELSGLTMAPRGIASAIAMAISSKLLMRGIEARYLIATGLVIAAYTTWLSSCITLDTTFNYIVWLGFVQGFGIGSFFMPLSTLVYGGLPRTAIAEASGLFSFGRNIGNAVGISLLTTYLDRDTQTNWNTLAAHVHVGNPNLNAWLAAQNLQLNDPHTLEKIGQQVNNQANFVAYLHTYRIAAIVLALAFFMTILLKQVKKSETVAAPAH
jgi:DHA2 family multidrug resistance protein